MPRTEEALEQIRTEQRQKILGAAKSVFAEKGRSATMTDIAEEAGISQGLAYRYFTSKEEIFSILLKQTMESAGAYDELIKKIPGTPAERMGQIISGLLELRRKQPAYYQLLYHVVSDEKTPSEVREMVTKQGKIFHQEMRKLIVAGQERGEIANDDPDQLLEAIMAVMEGLWRRMSYLGPGTAGKNFPETKIILRMLKPDQRVKRK